jgi:5-hydroxyisourate hydrolase
MSRLSTHVLDTAHGRPAEGMGFTLVAVAADGQRQEWARGVTDMDGRARAVLAPLTFPAGRYELEFAVAAYFRAAGVVLADPPFLDMVTLRFGMAADGHYHVPLLVSPFGYTTYRGS